MQRVWISLVVVFLTLPVGEAADCSVSGVLKNKQGQAAAKTPVVASGAEKDTMRTVKQTKTDGEGRFTFEKLRCGKYYIRAMLSYEESMPQPIDISSSPAIELVVRDMKDAMKSAQEMTARLQQAQSTPDSAELAALRRTHMQEMSPQELPAYDAAPPEKQRQMHQTAVATLMMKYYSVGQGPIAQATAESAAIMQEIQKRGGRMGRDEMQALRRLSEKTSRYSETEMTSQGMMAWSAELVRKHLSEEDHQAFQRGNEAERSALMFRAATAMPAPSTSCSKFSLYMVDMDAMYPQSDIGSWLVPIIGMSHSEWDKLDAKGRCDVVTDKRGLFLKLALSLASEEDAQRVAGLLKNFKLFGIETPRESVSQLFGSAAAGRYDNSAPAEQGRMYRTGLTFQLSMMAAILAL